MLLTAESGDVQAHAVQQTQRVIPFPCSRPGGRLIGARIKDATGESRRLEARRPGRAQQADRVRHVGAFVNGVPGDSSLPARLLSEPDDECRVLSVREQPSAWIAQDLQPSLSDL
jgi:hypothetical protein